MEIASRVLEVCIQVWQVPWLGAQRLAQCCSIIVSELPLSVSDFACQAFQSAKLIVMLLPRHCVLLVGVLIFDARILCVWFALKDCVRFDWCVALDFDLSG